MFWNKKPKAKRIEIKQLPLPVLIRQVIYDTMLMPAEEIAYAMGLPPISDDVAEMEERESQKRLERFATLFAEYEQDELKHLLNLSKFDINKAKEELSYRLTMLCHGKQEAEQALKSAVSIFYTKNLENDNLSALPTVKIELSEITTGIKLQNLLTKSRLSDSNLNSKRLIQNKSCKVNGQIIEDPYFKITEKDFTDSVLNISIGKKRVCKLVLKS